MTDIETACGDDPPFRIITKRDSDKVEVTFEKDMAAISIRSPFGISHAVIERSGNVWPDNVMLRLHLKGLENFRVTNGKITLEAALSSRDGKVRLWKDDKNDERLDAKSPYWMEIRMVGKDAVVEALFRAYFTDGKDIGNRQTLIDVAAEAGLNRQASQAMLSSDDGMDVISNGREMSQRHHVDGVPFFIINNAITLSGAQAPETFLDAFKQASA